MTSPLRARAFQPGHRPVGWRTARSIGRTSFEWSATSAEAIGVALAKRFGIEGQGADALARLRALPAHQL